MTAAVAANDGSGSHGGGSSSIGSSSHVQLYSLGCHKLLDLYPPSPPTCLRTCLADAATAAKIAARKELVKNKTGDELRWLKHKAYYK